jgi:hypothetical protein
MPPEAARFKPGTSGNYSGRPAGDGVVRKLILGAFRQSRAKALEAIRRRLESPKYVQDVLELLARLQGEFVRETADGGPRGVRDCNSRGRRDLARGVPGGGGAANGDRGPGVSAAVVGRVAADWADPRNRSALPRHDEEGRAVPSERIIEVQVNPSL